MVVLYFSQEWEGDLNHLPQGEPLVAAGTIAGISRYSVDLENCEVFPAESEMPANMPAGQQYPKPDQSGQPPSQE
jgi:hypothetical protein